MKTLALVLLVLLALPSFARAADPVQAFVLSSPSGQLELRVKPQQASSEGDCSYELWRAGEQQWTVTRPFVLQEGVLSDGGVTLGFARTRTNLPQRGRREVTIWRIGAGGEARLLEAIRLRSPRIVHGSPSPFMHDLWLDNSQALGIVYFSDYELFSPEKREHYLAFNLATGDMVPLAWTAETPTEGVWRVADGMRPLVEIPTAPEPVPLQPNLLKTVTLLPSAPRTGPETQSKGPVQDVVAFEPLAGGGLELVTCQRKYQPLQIRRVNASGDQVGTPRTLDSALDPGRALCLRFPDGAWLLARPNHGLGSNNETYWIDPDPSTEPVQLPDEGLPVFEALAPLGPTEFVALGSRLHGRSLSRSFSLGRYTKTGEILWQVPLEDWYGGWIQDDPFPRYELAVVGEGEACEIFVLRGRKRVIEVFSSGGNALRTIDLPTSTGRMLPSIYPDDRIDDPRALVSVTAAPGGDLLVSGFEAANGLLRIDVDSAPRQSFLGRLELELPSGTQHAPLLRHLRLGPNGALWSTDGNVVVRFEEDGSLSQVFGTPQEERLGPQRLSASIDSRGWIFVGAGASGPFFMTDKTGAQRGIVTLPSEFAPRYGFGCRFSHDSTGRLFFDRTHGGAARDPIGSSWEFSPAGKLTRWVDHGLLRAAVTLNPNSAHDLWVGLTRDGARQLRTLVCLDTDLHVLARTDRRPDGSFYRSIDDLLAGPRGEVAVLERDFESREEFLTLTTASFETGTTVRLSGHWNRLLAIAAPWALISVEADKELIHLETGRRYSVGPPAELRDRRVLATGLSPEGDELWYVTAEPLELWRFLLPKAR